MKKINIKKEWLGGLVGFKFQFDSDKTIDKDRDTNQIEE